MEGKKELYGDQTERSVGTAVFVEAALVEAVLTWDMADGGGGCEPSEDTLRDARMEG